MVLHAEHPLPTVVADIGGTHARFAWLNPRGEIDPVTKLSTKAFAGLDAALLLLARGGGYPAGGILPGIIDRLVVTDDFQ